MKIEAKREILKIILQDIDNEDRLDEMIQLGLKKSEAIRSIVTSGGRRTSEHKSVEHCGRRFVNLMDAVRACYPLGDKKEHKRHYARIQKRRLDNNEDPSDHLPPLPMPKKKSIPTDEWGVAK